MKKLIQPHINTTRFSYYFIKRFIDILLSILLIIILSPMYIIIILLIYFSSGLPILYPWRIIGFRGKYCKSWKFRTMVVDAEGLKDKIADQNEMRGPIFKMKNDPRITKVGKFLRKYSMDESVQLFSILKGDMSLVGPRPPLISEWKQFDGEYRKKVSVRPGLTGLWQVSGRNQIYEFDDVFSVDMKYIDNWSLWLDFKILFMTIPAVFKGTGY